MIPLLLLAQIAVPLPTVHGVVRAANHGAPIAGVVIELDARARAMTDSAGRYLLDAVRSGPHQLRFVAPGYQPRAATVAVADSTDLDLDVELTAEQVLLPPLAVVAATGDTQHAFTAPAGTGPYRIGSGWQQRQLAGDVDVNRAVAAIPGVASRGVGPALSVHGGFGSQNAVLLDGIPLFGAVHFAGASSGVNPDAVRDIGVYTGVQPARFGDVLGGVIELNTGNGLPATTQWIGDLTAVDARTAVRMPLGRSVGLTLGARASFRDLLTDHAGLGARNGYQDVVAATEFPLAGGTLHAVGFASANRLHWAPFASADGNGSDGPLAGAAVDNAAEWSSGAAGFTWRTATGANRSWSVSGWWSGTVTAVGAIGTSSAQSLNSGLSEFGVSLDRRDFGPRHTTVLGVQLQRPRTWYAMATRNAGSADAVPGFARFAEPTFATAFGEWDWAALRAIDLSAGLRATGDIDGSGYLDPRLTVNLHPGPSTRLTLAYGRNHQPLQSMLNEENVMSLVVAPALLVAPGKGAPIAASGQWQAGAALRLSRITTLSFDAYSRHWNGVLTPAVNTTGYFQTAAPAYGSGAASGVFASVAAVRGRFTIDFAAGLAQAAQRAGGFSYRIGTGQPWSISGDLAYRPDLQTAVQLRWNAGAGQLATPLAGGLEWQPYQPATGSGEVEGSANNLLGPINGDRLPAALRIDFGARRTIRLGNRGSFHAAIQLENLLNSADPVGIAPGAGGALRLLRGTPRGVVFELGWQF